MRFACSDIAAATGGELRGADVDVTGAGIDTRTLTGGELFVPIVGARDGHDFVVDALRAGAAAYLTAREPLAGTTAVVVADTTDALRALASAARERVGERVVGITGSVGKTSTKDLLAACLRERYVTGAAVGSFNNELGVPLTLVNAPDGAEALVVEMGARGPGHVAELCALARPTTAVVTRVAPAHLETFGSVDGVAAAKSEIVRDLPADGTAVLNADDERVVAMREATRAGVVTYSAAGAAGADIVASDVELDDELRARFALHSPWGTASVRLGARGLHNVGNALAAAAAALSVGVPLDGVVAALATSTLSHWRMELLTGPTGLRILNDAYNANPTSMEAALRALVRLPANRHVAVLGRMGELGELTDDAHREAGELARSLGVETIAVAEPGYGGHVVADVDAALAALAGLRLGHDDALLVKASRAVGLEALADRLLTEAPIAP